MMIFKKVSALAVRHICNPEPMGVIAESLAKKGIDAATATAEGGLKVAGSVLEEAGAKLLGDWAKDGIKKVRDHFTDHSEDLTKALTRANDQAWKTIEVALGGKCLLDRLASADDRGLRDSIVKFLDAVVLPAESPNFLASCLAELRTARAKHHLTTDGLFDPATLADELGPFACYDDPEGLFDAERTAVKDVSHELRRLGYQHLGRLLAIRPTRGQPLLAMAVQHYFNNAVVADPALRDRMFWVKLIAIDRHIQEGFELVTILLARHGEALDQTLEGLSRVEAVVVDTHDAVLELHEKMEAGFARVSGRVGVSYADEYELRFLNQMKSGFRSLPEDQRRRQAELGLDVGLYASVLGRDQEALTQARDIAESAAGLASKVKALHDAFQHALKLKSWDDALALLQQLMAADPGFSLWPRNKFKLERILGAGAFGVAFLCWNNYKKRWVVLKCLQMAGMDRDVASVFHEAETLDKIGHPGIVKLFDCGYGDDAAHRFPYLELEYFADSQTLRQCVEGHPQGKLSPVELLPIALQMAEALQAAHDADVWHRDVKPDNVLVKKTKQGWEVKVIDFGLSLRRMSSSTSQARQVSQNRFVVGSPVAGTPEFAAPEQLNPIRTTEVGTHTDVFGFGRTCFYALFKTTQPGYKELLTLTEPWRDLLDDCCHREIAQRPKDFAAVLERLQAIAKPGPGVATLAPVATPTPLVSSVPSTPTARVTVPPAQGPTAKPAAPSPAQPVSSVMKKVEPPFKAGWIGTEAGDRKVLRLKDQEIAFRWCPPGSFKMGDERVDVTLTKGFWMMETRVTQGLWRAAGGIKLHWSFAKGPNLPVFNVNHEESEDFAVKSTKLVKLPEGWKLALPTEAQWEYAARAGTTSTYFFGEDEKLLGEYAWFNGNSNGKPHEVGTTRRGANPWGLHDMLGNVWEWCADGYGEKHPGGVDPVGPKGAALRVDRGGGWRSGARYCRSAYRYGDPPDDRDDRLGHRLAAGQE